MLINEKTKGILINTIHLLEELEKALPDWKLTIHADENKVTATGPKEEFVSIVNVASKKKSKIEMAIHMPSDGDMNQAFVAVKTIAVMSGVYVEAPKPKAAPKEKS